MRRPLLLAVTTAILLLAGGEAMAKIVRLDSVKMTFVVPDDWKVDKKGGATVAWEPSRNATIALAVLNGDLSGTAKAAEELFAKQYTNYRTLSKSPGQIKDLDTLVVHGAAEGKNGQKITVEAWLYKRGGSTVFMSVAIQNPDELHTVVKIAQSVNAE
jgi:hypothetical protein